MEKSLTYISKHQCCICFFKKSWLLHPVLDPKQISGWSTSQGFHAVLIHKASDYMSVALTFSNIHSSSHITDMLASRKFMWCLGEKLEWQEWNKGCSLSSLTKTSPMCDAVTHVITLVAVSWNCTVVTGTTQQQKGQSQPLTCQRIPLLNSYLIATLFPAKLLILCYFRLT